MKSNILWLALLLVVTSCGKEETISLIEPTTQEHLQAIIDSKTGRDADKLVGVSVSIRVDGIELWRLVGGESKDSEPMMNDMKFGIGSITKTAIAATVLKLEEEGLLSLDDSIGKWLSLDSPNVDESITIFQLLAHFTGLKGYFQHPDIWTDVEADLDSPISKEQLVSYIGAPINQPGVTHEYSNSNYLLLALIVEKITNRTIGEVMRENFWAPLQLDGTYFGANEDVPPPVAAAWRDGDGDGVLEDISSEYRSAYYSVFYGPAGMFSTASDLSMWAYHLFEGNALSETSKQQMMTSYFDYGHPTFLGYGLGARKNMYAGRTMWGHTGGVRGYGSHMFYDPLSKVSIAILNNQSRSTNGPVLRHELAEELLKVVFDSI